MTPGEVERLGHPGWFTRDDFPGAPQAAIVARRRVEEGRFAPAGISRAQHAQPDVRGDALSWVAAEDAELAELCAGFEALQRELNQDAWLGLTRFELQLAHYPGGGARYQRHRDAFENANQRRVTAIVYLNPGWLPADGGQLRLHTEPPVELEPRLGRAVIFLSEKIEHEVLPAWAPRLAATAWFYAG